MQKTSLIISPLEYKERKALHTSLKKKKQKLTDLITEYESLQMELDTIQHEYNVRIGSLLLQDNELDLKIIRYRNIQSLMDEGMSYENAVRQVEGHFYSEILRIQKEQERIEAEKQIDIISEVPEKTLTEIKSLWKKLIQKFHPDLVTDKEEKSNREKLMKQINHAYTVRDLEALQILFANATPTITQKSDRDSLERALVDTENMIISTGKSITALRKSQWFTWRTEIKKNKTSGRDIFKDLETKLTDDVLSKIATLRELKETVLSSSRATP